MERFVAATRAFFREEDATAVTEYGIMLALIIVGAAAVVTNFSDRLWAIYSSINVNTPES